MRPLALSIGKGIFWTGMSSAALSGAALLTASLVASRAFFGASAPVKIASEIRLFDQKFRFNKDFAMTTIAVPTVRKVKVSMPIIRPLIPKEEMREITDALSGVGKEKTAGLNSEREMMTTLRERFRKLEKKEEKKQPTDQDLEESLDRDALHALFVEVPTYKHAVAMNIQSFEETQVRVPAPAEVKPELKAEPTLPEYSLKDLLDIQDLKETAELVKPKAEPLRKLHIKKVEQKDTTIKVVDARQFMPEKVEAKPVEVAQLKAVKVDAPVQVEETKAERAEASSSLVAAGPQQTALDIQAPSALLPMLARPTKAELDSHDNTQQTPTLPAPIVTIQVAKPVEKADETPAETKSGIQKYVMTDKASEPQDVPAPPVTQPDVPAVQTLAVQQASKPTSLYTGYQGRILEAFTGGAQAVVDADVQILGTPWTAKTDIDGHFVFQEIAVEGVLPVLVTKTGYLSRRLELRPLSKTGTLPSYELVSENSAAMSAVAAGDRWTAGSGLIFGQITAVANSESAAAMKVEVSGPAIGHVIYLDERGVPNPQLQMTSSRGQFLFLNAVPGTYLIAITDAFGQDRAPHLVHLGKNEGIVRKFSMGELRTVRGKVFNATSTGNAVDQAKVQLLGSVKTTTTDAKGNFVLGPMYVDCSSSNYLQVEKDGFYLNRLDYACGGRETERALYVFPKAYIDGIAADAQISLNEHFGAVIGHVSFKKSVKVQLWGPDEVSPSNSLRGKDFYFEKDGVLRPLRDRTSANGNFAILEAPEGLSYVQAFGKDERTLSYWPIFISPSVVNVYLQ